MRELSQHLPFEVNGRARAEPAGAPVFQGQPVVDVQRLELPRCGHVEVFYREPGVVVSARLISIYSNLIFDIVKLDFLAAWPFLSAGLSRLMFSYLDCLPTLQRK